MIKKLKILHSPRSKVTKLLRNAMPVYHIGHLMTVLESVDSSNNYAMARVHARLATHGECFLAMEQTAGKGRMGRQWTSMPGQNILLSIVLDASKLNPNLPFLLSMAIALGCSDWLDPLSRGDINIKWPNDLYWRDRKAGGILIENKWSGFNWQFAIAGIGINVNQVDFNPMAKRPVSLKQITGKDHEVLPLVKDLLACLEWRWQQLANAEQHAVLLNDYNQLLYSKGKKVLLRKGSETFETTIMQVNASGELITSDTSQRRFRVGEVEWVL